MGMRAGGGMGARARARDGRMAMYSRQLESTWNHIEPYNSDIEPKRRRIEPKYVAYLPFSRCIWRVDLFKLVPLNGRALNSHQNAINKRQQMGSVLDITGCSDALRAVAANTVSPWRITSGSGYQLRRLMRWIVASACRDEMPPILGWQRRSTWAALKDRSHPLMIGFVFGEILKPHSFIMSYCQETPPSW